MNINLKQWLVVLILAGLTLGTQGVLAEEPTTEVSVEVETNELLSLPIETAIAAGVETYPEESNLSQLSDEIINENSDWIMDTDVQPTPVQEGIVTEGDDNYLYIAGVKQLDATFMLDNKQYYFDESGVMSHNKWAYSSKNKSWYYSDENGEVIKEANATQYSERGQQLHDIVVNINENRYYYEPQFWGGVLASNKWAYGVKDATWYYADAIGRIRKEANHTSYKEDGVQQSDTVLNINGVRYYYEPQYWGSVLARNKWAYGVKDATWYYADAIGRIRKEANHTSYKEDGVQQSDTVLNINGVRYYYEPQYWGSVLARNKWAYGVKDATWYYADAIGRIRKEANYTSYKEDGVQQSDIVLNINGVRYYYEPQYWGSVLARNKWAYGVKDSTWYYADAIGRIRKEANHTSYKEDGVQQSDIVLNINGVRYYYEPQYWGSVLARNKWAYGVKDATWYRTNAQGIIISTSNTNPFAPNLDTYDVKLNGINQDLLVGTNIDTARRINSNDWFGQRFEVNQEFIRNGKKYLELRRDGKILGFIEAKYAVQVPRDKKTIYIDSGHGGKETGTVNFGVAEKDLNLIITLQLAERLRNLGYIVYESRTTDKYINLRERQIEPNSLMPDIYISVHHNAMPASRAGTLQGILSLYHDRSIDEPGYMTMPHHPESVITEGKRLAQTLQHALIKETGAVNMGARPQNLHVTRTTDVPATLVELGFMDHWGEHQKLINPSYQQKLINGLINGINAYFGKAY